MIALSWTILWLPFLAACFIGFFLLDRPKVAAWFATACLFLCLGLALILAQRFLGGAGHASPLHSSLSWISLGSLKIEFGILLNGLSLLMLLVVTGIGSLIFLYSVSYMEREEGAGRYFACLSFFAFSMLGIVLADNLIQIFIFWELVGFSSYLLIGFWYQKKEAVAAGKKAFMTTRVGDVGMLVGILMLFAATGTFNFLDLESVLGAHGPVPHLTLIALSIFLGVVGKSAQVPLHVWLPDAMEGPTPVSALIHAATMVAAGVFLLARLFFLFGLSPLALTVIAWTGAVTAFLAGSVAMVQNDIKKILAYSTLSQLGYMVLALGLASPEAGMFHLVTHAFFKALLFLAAGSLIHALHTQDIWQMGAQGGSLWKEMRVTTFSFLFGALALVGIPPFSGYYSKEQILLAAQQGSHSIFLIAMITLFITAFYMSRLWIIVFWPNTDKKIIAREADWKISIPLIILGLFSFWGGHFPVQKILGSGHVAGTLPPTHGLIAISAFVLAALIYKFPALSRLRSLFRIPERLLQKKFFFDDFYDWLIPFVQENFARFADWLERRVVVEAGVNGTARLVRNAGDGLRKFQTGMVQFYALVFAAGIAFLIALAAWMHPS